MVDVDAQAIDSQNGDFALHAHRKLENFEG